MWESQLTYCLGIAALAITILIWRAPHFPDRLARFLKSLKIVMRDSKRIASYYVFVFSMVGLLLMIATILMNIRLVFNTVQYSQDLFTFYINRSPVLDVVVQKIEIAKLTIRLKYLTSQFRYALFILASEGCWVSLTVIFTEYIKIDKHK